MLSNSKRALIAEDNAALRRVIGFTLKASGFEVVAASDGLEAWEVAQDEAFDLVVTDQQMPHLTGLELIERLRGSATNATVPVILLTAKGMELKFEEVHAQYGIEALLAKPFSPKQLGVLSEELVGQPA